jgi:hypothetical protein
VAPVGIIANPLSGKDVRRLLTNAATSSLEDKVNVVRRLLVGAFEAGASDFLVLAEPHGVVRRALRTLPFASALTITEVPGPLCHDERDTIAAADAMRDAGCAAVVVLGGDGTNRAVALGWPGCPVIPLSTGTNNAFPEATEATIAGAAAGHLATGGGGAGRRRRRRQGDRRGRGRGAGDVALIDAVLLREPRSALGSLAPFDPASLAEAVLARAEPAAVGASSIGGVLVPSRPGDDIGVGVSFAPVGDGAIRSCGAAGTGDLLGRRRDRLAPPRPRPARAARGPRGAGLRRRPPPPPAGRPGSRPPRAADGPMVVDVALVLRAGTVRSHWVRSAR